MTILSVTYLLPVLLQVCLQHTVYIHVPALVSVVGAELWAGRVQGEGGGAWRWVPPLSLPSPPPPPPPLPRHSAEVEGECSWVGDLHLWWEDTHTIDTFTTQTH